jgi:hypothetical protein
MPTFNQQFFFAIFFIVCAALLHDKKRVLTLYSHLNLPQNELKSYNKIKCATLPASNLFLVGHNGNALKPQNERFLQTTKPVNKTTKNKKKKETEQNSTGTGRNTIHTDHFPFYK